MADEPSNASTFVEELLSEVRRILQFWQSHMVDREREGFYGRIDGEGRLHPEADKGVVLNTRILWTFAAAHRHFGDTAYRHLAVRACDYLRRHFADQKHGGVYWMLDCEGKVLESKKQIYAQAFAVYALAEYHQAVLEEIAREWAIELFYLIEKYSYDEAQGGYLEAFSQDWKLLDDLRLSDKDANEVKTMNTHLHVLEAYTNLYRIWRDELLRQRLEQLIQLFLDTILDTESAHLGLFFDENWQLRSQKISFGHDIEAAWLLTEAAELLEAPDLLARVQQAAVRIAEAVLKEGVGTDGGLLNEAGPDGFTDTHKDWWPQAEAMVGFYNAYRLSGDLRFFEAAQASWKFTKNNLIDRENGEWYWAATQDGQPMLSEDKAGPWKAPYHNTRACLEMVSRLKG